jgi:hypothetical protein
MNVKQLIFGYMSEEMKSLIYISPTELYKEWNDNYTLKHVNYDSYRKLPNYGFLPRKDPGIQHDPYYMPNKGEVCMIMRKTYIIQVFSVVRQFIIRLIFQLYKILQGMWKNYIQHEVCDIISSTSVSIEFLL